MLKLLDHPIAPPALPRLGGEEAVRRPPSERGLPKSASAQASASFDAFYRNNWRFVWRSLGRFGAAPAAMEDLFQEVFLIVHRRLPGYEPPLENPVLTERVWVLQIIRYVLCAHWRQQQRKGPAFTSDDTDVESMPATTATPHGVAERSERVQLLYDLLATLDEDKRELFVLVELEGLSVRDAALALQKNENTARSCLATARAELKRALERHRARDEWRLR